MILNVIDYIEKASHLIDKYSNISAYSSPNVTVSTLTTLYSKWVAGQINIDQFPVSSNFDTFKQSVTQTNVIGNTASMETPLSLLESFIGLPTTSIVVKTAPDIREVKMSMVLTKRVTLDPPLGALIHSNPLQLTIFDTSVCLSTGCSFTVLLQTIDNQTYFNGQSTAGVIYRHCNVGDNTTSINRCANGYAVMTSCDGLSKYDIKTQCPYRVTQPGCGRLSTVTSTATNDICTMISYSGSITYCNCTIPTSRYTLAKSMSVQIGTIVVSNIVTPVEIPTISPTSAPTEQGILGAKKNTISTANTIILSVLLSVGICCFCGSFLFFIFKKRRTEPVFKKWTIRADPNHKKFADALQYDEFYPVIPFNTNMIDQSIEPVADLEGVETSLIMKSLSATYPTYNPTPLNLLADINAGIYSEEVRSPEKDRDRGRTSSEDRSNGSDGSAYDDIPSPSCINICEIMNGPMTRPKPYFDVSKISNGSPSSRLGGSPPRSRAQPYLHLSSSSSSRSASITVPSTGFPSPKGSLPSTNFPSPRGSLPSTNYPSPRGALPSPSRSFQRDVTKTFFHPKDTDDILLGNLSSVEDEQTVDLSVLSGLRGSLKPYSGNSSTRQIDTTSIQIEFEKNISYDNDDDSKNDNDNNNNDNNNNDDDNDDDNDDEHDECSDCDSLPVSLGEIYVSALNPLGEQWSDISPAAVSLPTDEVEENEEIDQDSRPVSFGGIYSHALNPLGEEWSGMPSDMISSDTEEEKEDEQQSLVVSLRGIYSHVLGDQWLGGPGPVYIDNVPLRSVDSTLKDLWTNVVASLQSSSETLPVVDDIRNFSVNGRDDVISRPITDSSTNFSDARDDLDMEEIWHDRSSPPPMNFEIEIETETETEIENEEFVDLLPCETPIESEISEVRIIENNLTLEEVDLDIDADMDMDFEVEVEVEVGIREVEVAGDRKPADSITK